MATLEFLTLRLKPKPKVPPKMNLGLLGSVGRRDSIQKLRGRHGNARGVQARVPLGFHD